ncbi:enolase C-terminal domain-like protein [Nocardioides sp.]|uniref:enolase C-terminal domain-like protein n=1 Tax=Nocardioides sp. TaxID=35761 RepID=UPI0025F12187|nr:enolase C-terminal domain-like protein [Nocardioides sp.]
MNDPPAPMVERLEAHAYRIPTDVPEADGTLSWSSSTLVVVEAHARGHVGTGWTWAPAAAVQVVEELLRPVVLDASALAPAGLQEAMVVAVRNAGRPGLVGMAISAVDIALWDLGARLLEVSLAQWWDLEPRAVPVYGSGGFTTYDDERLLCQVEGWKLAGVGAVKIKIGESSGAEEQRDLHRTALVLDAVGPGTEVFVDANGGYGRAQAARVGHALEDLGATWFEEPVSSDDLEGLDRLHQELTLDVTAGEYGYDLPYFERLAPVVDCIQLDVTRCGGYTEWLRICRHLASRGRDVSAHCAPYLTAPVATVTPNLRHLEWFHDHVRIARELVDGYTEPVGGALQPTDRPGHGLSFRADRAERYRLA